MNNPEKAYNRFESELRHALNDYEVPFNPDDWALMEEELRRKNGGAAAWFAQRKWWIAATALALLLGTWQFANYWNSPSLSHNLNTLPTPTAPSSLPTTKAVVPAMGDVSTPDLSTRPKSAISPALPAATAPVSKKRPSMPTAQAPAATTKQQDSTTTATNIGIAQLTTIPASVAARPTNGIGLTANNVPTTNNSTNPLDDKGTAIATSIQADQAPPTIAIDQSVAATAQVPSATEATDTQQPVFEGASLVADPAATETATESEAETKVEPKSTKKYPAIKKPKKRVSAFYAMPTASVDGNFLSGRPLRLGTTLGLSLNYQFSRHWSIETGVAYTQKNFQMTTAFDQYKPVFPEQYRAEFARMLFVEIPLVVKFHVPAYSDECLPYVGIGNSIFLPIEKHYTYSLIDPPPTVIEGMNPAYYNPEPPAELDPEPEVLWRTIHLKAGASFKLNKKWRLNIESQFKASLDALHLGEDNPIIEKNSLRYTLYSFGLQTGLNYRF